jgi:hypothetical protein
MTTEVRDHAMQSAKVPVRVLHLEHDEPGPLAIVLDLKEKVDEAATAQDDW